MSGDQANVNPGELRNFARGLQHFDSGMNDMMSRLRGQFNHLGESWRDSEYQHFEQEFQSMVTEMQKFGEFATEYANYLMRKAQRAEDYLNQR